MASNLTAPHDRTKVTKRTLVENQSKRPLTEKETKAAMKKQYDDNLVDKYKRIDRAYCDPIYNSQNFCLHSFVPSKDAQPDKYGIYGFMKCRGTFVNLTEANQRAEYLVKNVDSINKILTGWCGRPFPVCANSEKFCEEVNDVELRDQVEEVVGQSNREQKEKDDKTRKELLERQEKLLEESKRNQSGEIYQSEESPFDEYTTLRVKRASLIHTFVSLSEKLINIKHLIKNATREIEMMDEKDPSYRTDYLERYENARANLGLNMDPNSDGNNFIKYLDDNREHVNGLDDDVLVLLD